MDNQAPKSGFRFLNLQAKLAIGFAILAIVSSGIVAGATIISGRGRVFQDLRNHLRDAVSIGALYIDGDTHATLTSSDQQDSETYTALKEAFKHVRDAGSNFRYVYSLRNIDDKAYFIVDAEEDPTLVSNLMDYYSDLPQSIVDLIPSMDEPYVQEEFYEDEWGVWLTGYAPIFTSDGRLDAVLAIDISAAYVVAYQNGLLWNTLLIYLAFVPLVGFVGWYLGRQLARPILTLIDGARRMESGDFGARVVVNTRDETALLGDAFNSMASQLEELVGGLESKVAERTREVEQRSNYLFAASEVGRNVTTILEPELLIPRIVDLIKQSFQLYYVGLFLVDENNEWAILRAGSGEAGKIMLDRGHRIRIGEGMIGWCIEHAQARVALRAEQDVVRLATPWLPETRSEAALPLRSRGRVFGALTVQSDQSGVFDDATISVLQTMADQVSIALDNARLYAESEQAVRTLRRSVAEYRRQAWHDIFKERSVFGYHGDVQGVHPVVDDTQPNRSEIPANADDPNRILVPLTIRGEVVGIVEARKPQASGEWSGDEVTLMNVLVDQLGVALENARHYEESRRRAELEQMLAQITARVRASADIDQILQTAVQELSEALRVPRGAIRLIRPESTSDRGKPNDGETVPDAIDGGTDNEQ